MGDVWRDYGLIFSTSIGTALEPRNVNRAFDDLRVRADLPWLRLHDLRHACATFLIAQGVEPRTVMEVLGHSTIRLTMDTYGHVLPSGCTPRRTHWIVCLALTGAAFADARPLDVAGRRDR